MTYDNSSRTIHEGRNIKRFREMRGIKQDALAAELGDDWNQQKISLLEQKETVDPTILQHVATVLKFPVELFSTFNEDQPVNIIGNTFGDYGIGFQSNENPIFHPIDKIIQLHEEKIALYERMLKEKDEMMARLEKLIERK